jgi:hypothetical protein
VTRQQDLEGAAEAAPLDHGDHGLLY